MINHWIRGVWNGHMVNVALDLWSNWGYIFLYHPCHVYVWRNWAWFRVFYGFGFTALCGWCFQHVSRAFYSQPCFGTMTPTFFGWVAQPPSNWRTRTIERTIVCRRFSQTHRSKEGFEKAAAMMKSQEVAILACGGDGTVTWILSDAGANIASSGVRPGQHSCYFSWASIHPQQNCGPSSDSIRARSVLDPGF